MCFFLFFRPAAIVFFLSPAFQAYHGVFPVPVPCYRVPALVYVGDVIPFLWLCFFLPPEQLVRFRLRQRHVPGYIIICFPYPGFSRRAVLFLVYGVFILCHVACELCEIFVINFRVVPYPGNIDAPFYPCLSEF